MSKVRINDLARELEVKSKVILDLLPEIGVTEKKTHSSSVEEDEAARLRSVLGKSGKPSAGSGHRAAQAAEQKPKIDLSNISRPGDVLRAIQQQKEQRNAPPPRPVVHAPAVSRPSPAAAAPEPSRPVAAAAPATSKPAVPPAASIRPAPPASTTPAPRRIVPQPRQAPAIVAPPPAAPAIASRPPAGPITV